MVVGGVCLVGVVLGLGFFLSSCDGWMSMEYHAHRENYFFLIFVSYWLAYVLYSEDLYSIYFRGKFIQYVILADFKFCSLLISSLGILLFLIVLCFNKISQEAIILTESCDQLL